MFSARIARSSNATTELGSTTTPATQSTTNISAKDSSENSTEDFEKIREELKDLLNDADKKEFEALVAGMEKAKTLDESLASMVKKVFC